MNREGMIPSDGPIALVAIDAYRTFVSKEWTYESLTAHFVDEMRAGHACVWGHNGDGGNHVVRVTDSAGDAHGFGELVTFLEIGPGGAYLVNYDALTMAAGDPDHPVARLEADRSRHVDVAPGRYRCRVVRLLDPALAMGNWQSSTAHVHFLVELTPAAEGESIAVSEVPWTETGEIPDDPTLEKVTKAREKLTTKPRDPSLARMLFLQSLKAYPDRADLLAELGEIELDRLDKPKAAAEHFAEAREQLGPRASAELYMLEARARADMPRPDLDEALRLARLSIELGGQDAPRLTTLGEILLAREEYQGAAVAFERGLLFSPRDPALRWQYAAVLYYYLRDGEAAERFFAGLGPKALDEDFLRIRGTNLVLNLHRFEEAFEAFAAANELAPDGTLLTRMACCKLCAGDVDGGRELAREAIAVLEEEEDSLERRIEAQFYLVAAAGPDTVEAQLVELARLMTDSAATAPGPWIYDVVAAKAAERGHPEAEWLPRLASVVHDDALLDLLAGWPAWQAAVAARPPSRGRLDHEAFAACFAGVGVPPELLRLVSFENCLGTTPYSDGFELLVEDKSGLDSWSEEEAFLAALVPFAQANGSGSRYALFAEPGIEDPSRMPVVIFGDEGGAHVVAEDVRGLMRLLTFDSEPMVDLDRVTFYKGEDHEPQAHADELKRWLRYEFGLDPVEDAEALVAAAQAGHKAAFDSFMSRFP